MSQSQAIQPESSPYVLGTGQDESVRLGLQHRLWSAAAHALWERAGVKPGQTVLDLGCGPGHASLDLSQIVGPAGRVVAVDESASFLKQLHDQAVARKAHHIERVLGDVQDIGTVLSEEAGQIDLAYARWVFCFLSRPEDVVKGLARLIKPGGKVAVQDYFNYERSLTLAPRCEAFSRVISAVGASWRSRGGDTDVMGKLPGMFLKHGFEVTSIEVVQKLARPDSTMWSWPNSFWQNYVPRLVENGFLTRDDEAAFHAAWTRAANDPGSFVLLPPVFELIATRR
ncbi:MAG: methyltransferase domain-containing protein [Phycisphaerales bacterium]